ncbi:MAG: PHP domain-containing protein [Chloroflexi bacterium]|nr:PHP domain-containing protein [Chloroflexota bacterium]
MPEGGVVLGKIDLHLHSTASDGRLSPRTLVLKAVELGLTAIALADHDSVDGVEEALQAAAAFPGLRVIPAVEISTDTPEGEVHILGYCLDYHDAALKEALKRFRESRVKRAEAIVSKLARLGVHVDWSRVKELAGAGSIGRPHIAQAMLEKGYIASLREAFNRYISQGGPAYVEREKMTPAEAVRLVTTARGLPVLAHPFTVNDPEAMVASLRPAGLVGLEAYYGNSTPESIERMAALARKFDLVPTGGSDYHGLDSDSEPMMGSVDVPPESVERLLALARQRGRPG